MSKKHGSLHDMIEQEKVMYEQQRAMNERSRSDFEKLAYQTDSGFAVGCKTIGPIGTFTSFFMLLFGLLVVLFSDDEDAWYWFYMIGFIFVLSIIEWIVGEKMCDRHFVYDRKIEEKDQRVSNAETWIFLLPVIDLCIICLWAGASVGDLFFIFKMPYQYVAYYIELWFHGVFNG